MKTGDPLKDSKPVKKSHDPLLGDVAGADARAPAAIKEAFRWVVPEFTTTPKGKKSVRIKGVAIPKETISRNKRKYLDEELRMAARTFVGKPLTVNHDPRKVAGNVTWMEYEDGAMEYMADVNKEPYVTMVRRHDPKIKGVSIDAAYLHNRCVKCGERFFSEKAFRAHMGDKHGTIDGVSEVHGIMGNGLSLVISPEEPGVQGTTIELAETAKTTILRLCETSMSGRGFSLKEQDVVTPEEAPVPPCPEGWHEVDEKCVKDEVTEQEQPHECPEGTVYNPETKACVKPDPEKAQEMVHGINAKMLRMTEAQRVYTYNYILMAADQNITRYKQYVNGELSEKLDKLSETLKAFSSRLSVMETGLTNKKTLTESAGLKERVTKLENEYSHIRGSFKGHAPSLKETVTDHPEDPLKKPPKKV